MLPWPQYTGWWPRPHRAWPRPHRVWPRPHRAWPPPTQGRFPRAEPFPTRLVHVHVPVLVMSRLGLGAVDAGEERGFRQVQRRGADAESLGDGKLDPVPHIPAGRTGGRCHTGQVACTRRADTTRMQAVPREPGDAAPAGAGVVLPHCAVAVLLLVPPALGGFTGPAVTTLQGAGSSHSSGLQWGGCMPCTWLTCVQSWTSQSTELEDTGSSPRGLRRV